MGYKSFGIEEATSADINTYLIDQAIVVCTSGTRPSLPPDGMHIWQSDDKTMFVRVSGAWRPFARTHYAIKAGNESVTSSITLQDDDHMFLAVQANATYRIRAFLFATGSGGDLKISWSVPSGASLYWSTQAPNIFQADERLTNISVVSKSSPSDAPEISLFTDSPNYLIHALLIVGGTSGTLQFRWAQSFSSGTATTLKVPSTLMATRVA